MSKYTIDFTINGLIDIESDTKEEALKKYNDLSWCDVINNGYDLSEEIQGVIKNEEENKSSISLKKFILDWLECDESEDEYTSKDIDDLLSELGSYDLIDLIEDIMDNF